jgi:hypothetical protein
LLVLDELFVSVLPLEFRTVQAIHFRPRPGIAHPWNGIPCDLGDCTIWLINADLGSSLQLNLTVRLPQQRASPEPQTPLIGTEFLRRYQPRLTLRYARFSYDPSPPSNEVVGRITWA